MEILNTLTGCYCLPNHNLIFKMGYIVEHIQKLDMNNGNFNVTRYIFGTLSSNIQFLRGVNQGHFSNRLTLPIIMYGLVLIYPQLLYFQELTFQLKFSSVSQQTNPKENLSLESLD